MLMLTSFHTVAGLYRANAFILYSINLIRIISHTELKWVDLIIVFLHMSCTDLTHIRENFHRYSHTDRRKRVSVLKQAEKLTYLRCIIK